MTIYKCTSPGCEEYSINNSQRCLNCGQKNWTEAHQSKMTDSDWVRIFELADSEEAEFAIAQAWAESGAMPGIMMLGGMYAAGSGCKKDESKAFEWWSKAADRKYPEAIRTVGMLYLSGSGVGRDISKGLSMLWKASDLKDAVAPCILGLCYDNGRCVGQDQKKAQKLFKLSAERGDLNGMYAYGVRLMKNAKSANECETALSWLWRASRQDHPESQFALGNLLSNEADDWFDLDQSKYWLHRAAVNECDGAASALAHLCLDVDSPADERDEILRLLHESFEHGDYTAAKALGDLYSDGFCVKQDFEQAFKFYRCGQGADPLCSAMTAHCYRFGEGVEKNVNLAFKIFKELYDEGEQDNYIPMKVILELADMYEKGEGTSQNRNESVRLYSMAAAAHNPCGMGQIGRFILEKHPFVKGTVEEAVRLLREASENDDYDSMVFLSKYYFSLGDREQSMNYLLEALSFEDSWEAAEFANENFPELMSGCE